MTSRDFACFVLSFFFFKKRVIYKFKFLRTFPHKGIRLLFLKANTESKVFTDMVLLSLHNRPTKLKQQPKLP